MGSVLPPRPLRAVGPCGGRGGAGAQAGPMLAGPGATELCRRSQDRALAVDPPTSSEAHSGEAGGTGLCGSGILISAPPPIKFKQATGAWLL